MAHTVGGVVPSKIIVGTNSPVKRVYVGRGHVWPPVSTEIVWLGSNVGSGPDNTFGLHTPGMLLVALGFGSSVTPAGWTKVWASANDVPWTLSYTVATASGTKFPTLTGATDTVSYVFSGASSINEDSWSAPSSASATSLSLSVAVTRREQPSLVVYCYYSAAQSGGWLVTNPGGLITKNTQNKAISNHQLIDTIPGESGVLETIAVPHNIAAAMRSIAFELTVGGERTPPVQKVTYVGSTAYSGSVPTFPSHVAGDLLVVAANGSSSASTPVPVLPAGFTEAYHSSNTEGLPVLIGYKIATAPSTPAGTWKNAAASCGYVFRGADTTTPFGAFNSTMNAASTPAVTPVNTAGECALVHYFYNNGTTGAWGASPVGFVARNATARVGNLLSLDSTHGLGAQWSHTASPVPNFRTVQFEVLPAAEPFNGADTGIVAAEMPAGAIKGNADSGLYHMPNDPHYDETIAEQTFDTEAQAKTAGYKPYTPKP